MDFSRHTSDPTCEPTLASATPARTNHTITACRLLLLLQQLIQHRRLTYAHINELFQQHEAVARPVGSETLTKYIATLRYWGCDIPKATVHNQFHYQLQSYPLPTGLTPAQQSVIQWAIDWVGSLEDPESTRGVAGQKLRKQTQAKDTDVVSLFAWWAGVSAQARPQTSVHESEPPLQNDAFPSAAFESQHLDCNNNPMAIGSVQACLSKNPNNAQVVELSSREVAQQKALIGLETTWHDHWQRWWLGGTWVQVTLHNMPQPMTLEPEGTQVTSYGRIVTGWEVTSGRWMSVPLSTILMMHPLPMRSRGRGQRMTVTFRLTGRLAKNYRLYPNETDTSCDGSSKMGQADNMRLIQARVDDTEALLTRLMKYGRLCEVLSPQWARESMQKRIHRLCLSAGGVL